MKKNLLLLFSALLILSVSMNAQNLIVDGDFETNNLDNWLGYPTSRITTDEEANSGTYSAKYPDGAAASLVQFITVEPGATYVFSFSAKWAATTVASLPMVISNKDGAAVLHKTAGISYSEGWTTVTEYFTIPDGVTDLKVAMWRGAFPTVYVDDVSVTKYNPERIVDGDFEEGDLAVAWTPLSKRVALETTDVYEGANSAKLSDGGNQWGSALKQVCTVIPGNTYRVSFTAKWSAADNNGLAMKFTDNASGDLIHITDGIATADWSTLTDSITIPLGVNELKVELWKPLSDPFCLVDSVTVFDLGSITPFISVSDAGDIVEGAEDGKIITVDVVNDILVSTLTPANYFATGLPAGVSFGSVSRIDDVTAEITLAGNTTEDYDNDITNIEVFVGVNEFVDAKDTLSATGIVFSGIDERIILSGEIQEDFEDGDTIIVMVENNTFAASLTLSNWTATNLPVGVTLGSVHFIEADSVHLILSGNTTGDYDTNITNATIEVAPAEFTLARDAVTANSGVTFVAAIEGGEVLIWEDNFDSYADGTNLLDTIGGQDWGFLGDYLDSATVTGGVVTMFTKPATGWNETKDHRFIKEIELEEGKTYKYYADTKNQGAQGHRLAVRNADNYAFAGPFVNSTDWVNSSVVASVAVGYDTVQLAVYMYNEKDTIDIDNMKLYMLIDPMLVAADDGDIAEGSEDGEIISVTLQNDTYVATLDAANWTVTNLPTGVSIGAVNRVDDTHVEIVLSGNASEDYDVDVTDVTISAIRDEFVSSNKTLSATEGVTFTAIVEPPTITISDDGEILEASEDLEVITVVLALDTFVVTLNPANYELTGQPAGVTIGEVYRVDDFTVEITLSGNTTEDYDTDITDASLTVKAAELKTYESDLSANTGVTFIAIVAAINNQLMDGFEVYPNPVSNMLNIASDTEIMKVQVYNVLGNLMSIMDDLNSSAVKIDVEHWNSGMYFVSITDKKGNSSIVKIIK